ncbi:MAG: anthranilate synthase component I family protein [Pseudomonadota bacterium]
MADNEQLPGDFDIVADLDTPVSAYLKLADLEPRYLLESVEGGTRLARYSFLGFGAASEITITRSGVRLGDAELALPADAAGLKALLRRALDATPDLAPTMPGLPFNGGLVGYAAYDIVRYFERLPSAAPAAHDVIAAYVGCESVLVFDHLTRRMALLHAGDRDAREQLKRAVIERLRGPVPLPVRGNPPTDMTASLDQSTFERLVQRCQDYIRAGDIYQIVLSVRFDGKTSVAPFDVYRALRLLNPSPYMFFLDVGGLRVAGSSPEALVRCMDGQASLRPIAGTRPRGVDADQDAALETELLADPKERAEHVMLVDLARNDLGRVARIGSVHVKPYMTVERYSHVMHIVSGVSGELGDDSDAFDLFAAAFPAGTLVGAPKVRAMQIIDELEPVDRGLYAGTVGYFGKGGDMDQAITIRTLVFDGDGYSFQAGAGIVADSDPTTEYHEVLHKSAILRSALAIAAEGL